MIELNIAICLSPGGFLGGKLGKENEHQKKGYKTESYTNCSTDRQFIKINHKPSKIFSNLNEKTIKRIAKKIATVNETTSLVAIANIINPAEILEEIEENTRKWYAFKSNFTNLEYKRLYI